MLPFLDFILHYSNHFIFPSVTPHSNYPPNQTHKRHSRFRIGSHPPGMALTKLTNLITGQGENKKYKFTIREHNNLGTKAWELHEYLCQKRNIGAQNTFKWVLICLIRTLLNFSCVVYRAPAEKRRVLQVKYDNIMTNMCHISNQSQHVSNTGIKFGHIENLYNFITQTLTKDKTEP